MYNSTSTIVRCIDSVVNQSYQNTRYEIIVVNDGSKDDSREVVEKYITESSNQNVDIVLVNQPNGGVSKARNAGLEKAQGDYIAFLDSDDAWKESKISIQMDVFHQQNLNVDFLATAFEEVYLKNKQEGSLVKIYFKDLIIKNYFQPSTVVMRRRVFDTIGYFREDQKYAEEGNYFMRIAYNYNCYFLNSKLIEYGDGKSGFGMSGLSANLKEMEKGELMNLDYIYHNKMINFPTYAAAYIFSIAKYLRRLYIVKMR